MTTTVDLAALAAAGQSRVTLLGGTITSLGSTGTDYAGFDDASAVYVEVQVQLRDSRRGAPSLTLLLEGSDDGNSWSTLSTFTFTDNGTQTATVDTPNAHLRVSWTVASNTEWYIDHVTVAPASLNAPGGGGGFTAVGCVLACDAAFTIHDGGNYDVLWDALYDNLWDLNPLLAIPAGLGLTFAFDGSSSLVVPTEAGIWTFSYFAERATDGGWAGHINVNGVGVHFPWLQQRAGDASAIGTPYMAGTIATPLPAGTQMTHQVAAVNNAAAGAYTCNQVWLSIVRHK